MGSAIAARVLSSDHDLLVSIGTPEKAVGLGQMAAKVAGSIAAAQNVSASRRSPL
jgi:3-hydroxyisobutyrate dehydrogenase-like beta-hydroxyacid dehydrogenase